MKTLALVALAVLVPLLGHAQTLEDGFEEWEVGADPRFEVPVGWVGSGFGAGKSSGAHSGNYAATVWNWYSYALGHIVTGGKGIPPWQLKDVGIPIDFIPTKLTGYYRYERGQTLPQEGIEAAGAVIVWLRRYDHDRQEVDTVSFVLHTFRPSDGWVPFSIDLPLRSQGLEPDTVVVAFYSSNPESRTRCGPDSSTCSYLSVDDVTLTSTSGVPYHLGYLLSPIRVLPNPVVDAGATLRFEAGAGKSYRLEIYDASGCLALEREEIGSEIDLFDLHLPSGAYYVSIVDAANIPVAVGKFVVE